MCVKFLTNHGLYRSCSAHAEISTHKKISNVVTCNVLISNPGCRFKESLTTVNRTACLQLSETTAYAKVEHMIITTILQYIWLLGSN